MLESLFNVDSVEAILNIPIPTTPKPDSLKAHQIPAAVVPSNTPWTCFWKLKMIELRFFFGESVLISCPPS